MVVPYGRVAEKAQTWKYRRIVRSVVRFMVVSLGCVLASAAGFVFLPSIEMPTRYPLRSFNVSGYIGMVAFVAIVFAVEGFRGRLKSEWLES